MVITFTIRLKSDPECVFFVTFVGEVESRKEPPGALCVYKLDPNQGQVAMCTILAIIRD